MKTTRMNAKISQIILLPILLSGHLYALYSPNDQAVILDKLITEEGITLDTQQKMLRITLWKEPYNIPLSPAINLHNKAVKSTPKSLMQQAAGIYVLLHQCNHPNEFMNALNHTQLLFLHHIRLTEFYQGKDLIAHQYEENKQQEIIDKRKMLTMLFHSKEENTLQDLKTFYETQKPYFATYESFESFIIRYYFGQKNFKLPRKKRGRKGTISTSQDLPSSLVQC